MVWPPHFITVEGFPNASCAMNFKYCHVEFGPSHWYFEHWYFEPLPKWNFWYYELSLGILIPPIWYFDTPVGILIPPLVFWTLRWYFDTPFWYFDHWYFDLWYFDLWYFELLPIITWVLTVAPLSTPCQLELLCKQRLIQLHRQVLFPPRHWLKVIFS